MATIKITAERQRKWPKEVARVFLGRGPQSPAPPPRVRVILQSPPRTRSCSTPRPTLRNPKGASWKGIARQYQHQTEPETFQATTEPMIRIAISFPINHALMRGGVTLASCSLLIFASVSAIHSRRPPAAVKNCFRFDL
jgi:hypothetical protein